jgi:pimeloyl-ACP methyl ester carboxylesterase
VRLLRTPEDRFVDLPDFDYEPHYAEVLDQDGGTLRMAYLRHGPEDGPIVLLLHGEPSWSFLYRKIIPVLADGTDPKIKSGTGERNHRLGLIDLPSRDGESRGQAAGSRVTL